MNATTLHAYRLLHEGTLAFQRAEQQGMRIDINYCRKKKAVVTSKIEELERKFMHTNFAKHWRHRFGTKFNMGSNFQLAHMLYDVKKIEPPKHTVKGKGSTDDETLTFLNIPELDLLLQIRKYKKVRDTYLDAFIREQVNGYMHPVYNLHLVRTYRSSSDSPNLQNIPKRDDEAMQTCRRAILPRPGHQLVEIDYKGIEVAIAACYNEDPTLIKYVSDPTTDMHGDMAKQIFFLKSLDKNVPAHKTLRDAAKSGFVFPEFYGDYYGNCAVNLACRWGGLPQRLWESGQGLRITDTYLSDMLIENGVTSFEDFTKHVKKIERDFWYNRFKVYQRWKDDWWTDYQNKGYMDMFTGFRCSGVMRKNEVINTPIQGTAFHCLLWSFIELDKIIQKRRWDSRLVGQIHDATLMDVHPKELNDIRHTAREVMCERIRKLWKWIIVPLSVEVAVADIDKPWSELS